MKKIVASLLFLLALIVPAFAQDLTVEASGYGVNRTDALTQAKREALAMGIGQMLTSQTEVENFMVKRDMIITQTLGFVKSFTVLKETQGADGAWELRIRAQVSKEGLSKNLAALKITMQTIGNPRVAVIITETNVDGTSSGKAEIVLLDSLKAKEFKLVDPNQALRYRESADAVKAMGGDPDAVAKLGSKLNAEVLIMGTVTAKESDVSNIQAFSKSGMKSASATVSLKAYNVSTREILAAKTFNSPAAHINVATAGNNAIEKAVIQLLGPKGGFFDALVESWRKIANDGTAFVVSIEGVKDLATIKLIKQVISTVSAGHEQRNFNKPVLELEITRSGRVEDLAEALDGLKVGSQKLEVEGMVGNTIQVRLK